MDQSIGVFQGYFAESENDFIPGKGELKGGEAYRRGDPGIDVRAGLLGSLIFGLLDNFDLEIPHGTELLGLFVRGFSAFSSKRNAAPGIPGMNEKHHFAPLVQRSKIRATPEFRQ